MPKNSLKFELFLLVSSQHSEDGQTTKMYVPLY